VKYIVYYEGSDSTKDWLVNISGKDENDFEFKRLPDKNNSVNFTRLPAYVADILYLDKPDLIISGSTDGVHEKPLFSIEFATCTPQYQHALQRFSRMVASISNKCPSLLIMPNQKRENMDGPRIYSRSRAVEYGAVKLMDLFQIPAFVFDWPDRDGILEIENGLPPIQSEPMQTLKELFKVAFKAFDNIDYIGALWGQPLVHNLVDNERVRAYREGQPTIERPGGGSGGGSNANIELISTNTLIEKIKTETQNQQNLLDTIPEFIKNREKSFVFYPTRYTKHAGDPYVGMISYYDIAFCRIGKSPRDRMYNLVAFCKDVSIEEVQSTMKNFIANECPFTNDVTVDNVDKYSYHLKQGCRATKSKPIRIYSELADLIIFKDGLLFNVG